MDAAPDFAKLQKPLELFRANTKRLALHPIENGILWVVATHVVLLPWAIGGMRLWAQLPSLALAVLGFALALLPRDYREEHSGAGAFRLITWPKLVRFPLFWLGLALLGYIALQGFNPAWEYRTDGKTWWMRQVEYVKWLPSGVEVPFERGGPWRMMIIYASVWLTVCTLWVGFTRRRTLQMLFLAIAANGVALAGYGIAQRMMGNGKMFWFWEPPRDAVIFSSFVYKNHAGAYLDLTLFVTCALAAWYYLRGLRRLEKSNPAGVLAFFATGTAVAVLVSYARGATVAMLAFLCLCIGAFIMHQLRSKSEARKPIVAFVLILIFGFFLKTGLDALGSKAAWTRLKSGLSGEDLSLQSRHLAARATLDLGQASWPAGSGSGSFKFLFPAYQQHYPEIFFFGGRRMYWEHAHNDIAQFFAELGVGGLLLMAAATAYLSFRLVRGYFWQNPLSAALCLGLTLLVAYSWWDFPFQCPAILLLWWVLAVGTVLWAGFEEAGAKG